MCRKFVVFFASVLIPTALYAQNLPPIPLPKPPPKIGPIGPPKPSKPVRSSLKPIPKIVVPSKERFRTRVMFLYDTSGSMDTQKLKRAFGAFAMIAKQPIDQMQIAMMQFASTFARWPGIPEPNAPKPVPKGWAAMPSEKAFKKASKWIDSVDVGGSTNFLKPLRKAFQEKRRNISIVIISDGFFNDRPPADFEKLKNESTNDRWARYLKAKIEILQRLREKAGLDRIHINCYGVGNLRSTSIGYLTLKTLAEAGKGLFMNEELPKNNEEDEDDLPP